MNVTELARRLKVNTTELFEKLPGLGFDIGRRAIKVDNQIAFKIMEAWRQAAKQEYEKKRIAQIRGGQTEVDGVMVEAAAPTEVPVPSVITVRDFSALLGLPVNKVLTQLLKNGVLTSMNERIDFDTALIVGEELGVKVIPDTTTTVNDAQTKSEEKLQSVLADKADATFTRPPVVVVMGHVDHGKTKILDTIRQTDVMSGESGGITQHIGAYQIHKHDRLITFIDTPGHEAFTAMRSRGARVADVAILVIAADDSVRPQTKEAIKIIQDAKLPFVVAINKIDKEGANIEKVKQDLASINLLPEDWGGNVICSPVSAKTGDGIADLLDTVLLVADMNKDILMVDASRMAIGTIIESHVDKGEGPVATMLVQAGTLAVGNILSVNGTFYGKVRALKNHRGELVEEALPGMPVKILGLKLAPEVGHVVEVATDMTDLGRNIKQQKVSQERDVAIASQTADDENTQSINLIIKSDVLGSAEAIIESLAKLDTGEIKIKIVSRGLGTITEADVLKAEATKATIIGFHVKPTTVAANLAREKQVNIDLYEVIYHLIEKIEEQVKLMVKPNVVRTLLGKLEVLKIFRKEGNNMIIGGRVVDGTIAPSDIVIVVRAGEALVSGKVNRIEAGKQIADKVSAGKECGLNYQGKPVVEEGDILEFYHEEKAS